MPRSAEETIREVTVEDPDAVGVLVYVTGPEQLEAVTPDEMDALVTARVQVAKTVILSMLARKVELQHEGKF